MKTSFRIIYVITITLLTHLDLCSKEKENHKFAYYKDGEIHINVLGTPEGKPLTTGHWDFKPSWSKTGDKLVFLGDWSMPRKSIIGRQPSVLSIPMDQGSIKLQMERTPTSTKLGPGMVKTPQYGTVANRAEEDTR